MNIKNKFESIYIYGGSLMMHSAKEFGQSTELTRFVAMKKKYTFDHDDVKTVTEKTKTILTEFYNSGANMDVVITPTYYTNSDGSLDSVRYTVRPSAKARCTVESLKTSFVISADEHFYASFISNFADWFDKYKDTCYLYDNLEELQIVFSEALERAEVDYTVALDIGEGIIDVTDNSIVLGITPSVIQSLSQFEFYNPVVEVRRENFINVIVDTLKVCVRPIDLVKQNNYIFKGLGIFSRKSVVKLIRKNVTRKLSYTRVGYGYISTKDYFAVVDKIAVTDDEVKAIKEKDANAYIISNENSTKAEREAGKNNIYIRYRVSPFDDDMQTREIDIRDIEDVTVANKQSA